MGTGAQSLGTVGFLAPIIGEPLRGISQSLSLNVHKVVKGMGFAVVLIPGWCGPRYLRGWILFSEERWTQCMEKGTVFHNAAKTFHGDERERVAHGEACAPAVTDEELATRGQDGDQEAAEELYKRYQKKAYAIAYHMCSGDREDAEEITQEAFLKVFRNLKEFRRDASFYTWFYRILVNTCLDSRRRHRRWERFFSFRRSGKQEKEPGPDEMEKQAGSGESFDPVGAVSSRQLSEAVHNALIALPRKQQVAFQLKVFEGMSISEIAQVMGSAKGTVKSHLFRATHSLREALKDWTVS